MKYQENKPAVLVLDDGSIYHGKAIGRVGTTTGEICFNTGMTGYQEIFTDPSYFGQIVINTTSHIGNYGVSRSEVESDDVKIEGLVCKKFTEQQYSRTAADDSIQNYFQHQGIVGIAEVDTRMLVRHIRDKGAMNAIISSEELDVDKLKDKLKEVPSMQGLELASSVSTKEPYDFKCENQKYKVAVLDLGVKKSILTCLTDRNCSLRVFPSDTPYQDILDWDPDGIMLSNGPGDPSVMDATIANVKELVSTNIPMFGICLGHQILSLVMGLSTSKMHNGHRGVNHPVLNLITGKGEITAQNHGFVVDKESAENNANIEITHLHLNDGTLAGLKVKDKSIFSVQFHPEASAGPHDSRYLFDEFIENIKLGIKEREQVTSN